jgi:hypothetical protein
MISFISILFIHPLYHLPQNVFKFKRCQRLFVALQSPSNNPLSSSSIQTPLHAVLNVSVPVASTIATS